MVEEVAGRAGEKFEEIALPFEVERAQAVSDFGRVEEGAKIGGEPLPCRQIGRRLKRERAQNVGYALEPRLISVELIGITYGELSDLGFRSPRRDLEIAPVGQRQEVRQGPLDDTKAMASEFEVADDLSGSEAKRCRRRSNCGSRDETLR